MTDPLTEIVTLLQPAARYSKRVTGAGDWRVQRTDIGDPFYCVVLEGSLRLAVDEMESIELGAGDFVLVPAGHYSTATSTRPPPSAVPDTLPVALREGEFRVGDANGLPDVVFLIGHCAFGSPDAALLVSLLPRLVHVRGQERLSTLVQLIRDESRVQRPARDVILERLLEVLLIEALRSAAETDALPGLLTGLTDPRLAAAIRRMHEAPAQSWTVAQLAKEASLSRSAFFERFSRAVGMAPMEYLLTWRMALAKNLLRDRKAGIADVAEKVGYSSASTFSVAFSRHVGQPPTRYARAQAPTHTA